MAGATMFSPSHGFTENDFVDWGGITDDFGNLLTLENAWLTESGIKKVMGKIGLSASVENRPTTEGWNGQYVTGRVYGPMASNPPRSMGPWRYYDANKRWIWLDGPYPDSYLALILAGKEGIARWMFQNRDNENVQRGLMYVSPVMFNTASELEAAINSLNMSSQGTGTVINTTNSGGGTVATGNAAGNDNQGSGQMSEETAGPIQNAAEIGDGGTGGATPSGMDMSQLLQGGVSIGGVQIPYVALGIGVIALMFMMGGGKSGD